MIRRTILVGLMSAFGIVASAGSAVAQTVGSVDVAFTGTVGLSCHFENSFNQKVTDLIGEMTYRSSGRLEGSTSVILDCTSPRAGLNWTSIQATKDGSPIPFTYSKNGFKELESSPNDLTPYLIFSPRELEIQPGKKRRIRVLTRLL